MSYGITNVEYNLFMKTVDKLTTYQFLCSVPYLASRHPKDIERYGVVITGHRDIDEYRKTERTRVYIPVKQMFDYFKNGITVGVCDPADAKDIYETIQAYLGAWKNHLEWGVNVGDAPLEDLVVMDEFANSVYSFAKDSLTEDQTNHIFIAGLNDVTKFNSGNIFSNSKRVNNNSDRNEEVERESMADFFKDRLIVRRF